MDTLQLKNNLKFHRIEKGISQGQLAEMVGVSRNTISSIETGQYSPTAKLAYSLCIALDKTFEELFYFDARAVRSEASSEDKKSEKEEKEDTSSLSNKAIQRIRRYLGDAGWSAEQILDLILYLTE